MFTIMLNRVDFVGLNSQNDVIFGMLSAKLHISFQ